MFKTICAAGVFVLAVTAASAMDRLITVSGQGQVAVAPDMATVTFGATSEDKSARAAMKRASDAAAAMMTTVSEDFKVAAKDLQTSSISLSPLWEHRNDGAAPRITGYRAEMMMTLRVQDLPQLGPILDGVLESGATDFRGLSFGLKDQTAAEEQARRKAVQDAVAKANMLASEAGVKIARVMSISEGSSREPRPVMMARMAADSMPIAEGEVAITADVSMVFEIGD